MDDRPILTAMHPPRDELNFNEYSHRPAQNSVTRNPSAQKMDRTQQLVFHENGLDTNKNNSDMTSNKQQSSGQRFETFVMTGDMIIRTTSPKKNKQETKSEKSASKESNGHVECNSEGTVSKPVTEGAQVNNSQQPQKTKSKDNKKSKAQSRIPKPVSRSPEKKPVVPVIPVEPMVSLAAMETCEFKEGAEDIPAFSGQVHNIQTNHVMNQFSEPVLEPASNLCEEGAYTVQQQISAVPPHDIELQVEPPVLDTCSPEYIQLQNAEQILESFTTDYSDADVPFPPPPEEAYAPAPDPGDYPEEQEAGVREENKCEACSTHLSVDSHTQHQELVCRSAGQLQPLDSPHDAELVQQQQQQQQQRPIVISKSTEKITFPQKTPVSQGNASAMGVRTSKSHENYLESEGLDSLALVSIDFEDNLALSFDALHHEKSLTSLENVEPSLHGEASSRSLDNPPGHKQHADAHLDKPLMPTFINLEEPRSIAKLKEGGRVREFQSDGRPVCDQSATRGETSALDSEDAVSDSSDRSAEFYDNAGNTDLSESVDTDRVQTQSGQSDHSDHIREENFMIKFSVENGCESDSDSVYHQPMKGVDRPSANRLAKRLFNLDGFKKTDISRHLCKKDDFSFLVGEEYLQFFDFTGDTLDVALRKFLKQITLTGETQERERVLIHFSHRFMECNPAIYNSDDAAHTLTCAMMLLNTDLHGQNIGRKMTLSEFIENLADLNEGENFPKDELKVLYQGIKNEPLECEFDEDYEGSDAIRDAGVPIQQEAIQLIGYNPFLDVPDPSKALEYKKGYVMRKCCFDQDGRRTPFGKRSWKMYFVTLRDMVLYLHKDEHGFKKSALCENLSSAIRIHHAMATKATDYKKKQHVFRLQTADWAQYLFQTSDSKELQSWVDMINLVAAMLSAPPLPSGVGSQRRFQRPLLPSGYTKLNLRDQLAHHEAKVTQLEQDLHEHWQNPPEKGAKSRIIQEYMEKETYLQYELQRFKTYVYLLESKLTTDLYEPSLVETAIGEVDEPSASAEENSTQSKRSPVTTRRTAKPVQRSLSDRYSYRAAIYQADADIDLT